MSQLPFSPGNLVSARRRKWIVLTGSTDDTLRLRPFSGSEDDVALLYLPLETEPVRAARFPRPAADQKEDRVMLGLDAPLRVRGLAEEHRRFLGWHRERVYR